jgi:hypothetical protein
MAKMLPSRITVIWRWLDLPTPYLSEAILEGMNAAKRPYLTLLDCPHNNHPDPSDRFTRKLRVAWRVAFREMRECGRVPLITLRYEQAA